MDDLDCQDVVEVVTDYLEGVLSPSEQARLERHLLECDGCDRYLAQINTVRRTLGKVDLGELPPDERVRFISTFRAWKATKAS